MADNATTARANGDAHGNFPHAVCSGREQQAANLNPRQEEERQRRAKDKQHGFRPLRTQAVSQVREIEEREGAANLLNRYTGRELREASNLVGGPSSPRCPDIGASRKLHPGLHHADDQHLTLGDSGLPSDDGDVTAKFVLPIPVTDNDGPLR